MIIYCTLSMGLLIPSIPILIIKQIANSLFIALTNKRPAYKGEGMVILLTSILLGPLIILLSSLIDLITLPLTLLVDSRDFEHKYQMSTDRLNDK